MNQKRFILSIVSLTAVMLSSCSNDAQQDGLCVCEENQVCSEAGICYDNAACASCKIEQVCVGGICYDASHACAVCDAAQVCFDETCYDADAPCAQCTDGQVCRNNQCLDADDPCAKCDKYEVCRNDQCLKATDPCAKCQEGQVCHQKTCYNADEPCAKCDETEICNKDICYADDDPCARCRDTEICYMGECADAATTCIPACEGSDICVEGQCEPCPTPCGDACCKEGTACDLVKQVCNPICDNDIPRCNTVCCQNNSVCDPEFGHCAAICGKTETRCDDPIYGISYCCNADQVCEDSRCKEDCKGGVRCNEVCCAVGDVCEENTCKIACDAATHTRCGENEEFCCDNATELCLYGSCLPRGKACETSNDCSFEEFCDESTKTCVLIENVPATCTVHPATGPFNPVIQWHWPTLSMPDGKPSVHPQFDQVMNNPAIINLTDDNGDGKIDENDIPDLIFTTFAKNVSGCHYTGMNVLRVISGADGTEIATHPDIKFYLSRDPGAAKVNNDEYPEIVVRRADDNGNAKLVILNLVPKTNASGYEFKEIARLDDGQFPRFANFEGDEYPEIVTSIGIIEYTEDENGIGTYKYRCKGSFGAGHGGHTIADLDGDGEPEIVGSTIYDKTCTRISTDSIASGTVLADIDLVSDNENGRLDVEQIVFSSGGLGTNDVPKPPPGKIRTYKVFKNAETGKFSRQLIWEREMPIDYDYAEKHMASNCKYDDGTKCTCDRAYYPTFETSSGKEGIERQRRKTCSTGGGPLVVADFDGDKRPDIGLVTTWSYVVFDAFGNIIWADFTTQDASSMATGSSLFDFEGDGVAEVLYADELELHVYKGSGSGIPDPEHNNYNKAELLITPIPNSSGTLIEYPLVVDVDNDGNSEIVVTSNDYYKQYSTGVRAFEDPDGHWVRTRRIWNQFDYHVTNINEDGTVPKSEQQNWKIKSLNNFRQNVQPGGLFNAPNLVAEAVTGDTSTCTAESRIMKLTATVSNKGSLGIRAGLEIQFYADNINGTTDSAYLGSAKVADIMTPGKTSTATLLWDHKGQIAGSDERVTIETPADIRIVVDAPTESKDRGEFIECIEDDNSTTASQIKGCPEQVN